MRVSERQRDSAAALLRRRFREGYLSVDTLVERLDAVSGARDRDELERPLADLPGSDLAAGLDELRARARALALTLRGRAARTPGSVELRELVLRLPRSRDRPSVLGRSHTCDVVIDDASVSRAHVQVTWTGNAWRLLDLGSLNGTWVGGRRVGGAEVPPGTRVLLGDQAVRLR